jgi:hypothetical protein
MSVRLHRGGWEVRWRDASGRQRARRFKSEDGARAFNEAIAESSPADRRADTARHGRSGGVYAYGTADAVRWRFVYRRSDGTQTTKRGFASERAARDGRRRLIERIERGEVRHTLQTFGGYWEQWLRRRRPYLEPGTWSGYEIAGRKRLLPARIPQGGPPFNRHHTPRGVSFRPALQGQISSGLDIEFPPAKPVPGLHNLASNLRRLNDSREERECAQPLVGDAR